MGKLVKKAKKYEPGAVVQKALIGEENFDTLHPIASGMEQQYDAAKAAEAAAFEAENKPAIPLPDEEELARIRRRRARRGGGRESTQLASETFGP